jgi:tetratricopeptide (TPR) repeat protein
MPQWKIGDRIENRYEIHQILGGGMGVVYICYDHEERIPLALKTFQDRYFQRQERQERFIREAETWVALEKHQNIVKAVGVVYIQNKPYIFLEYIANPEMGGANLGRWIRRGMGVPQVLNFAVQFCDGMDYAHKKVGMVHRDIKSDNILVTQDGVVKITDFGLVKKALAEAVGEDFLETAREEKVSDRGSFTRSGAVMGTPAYMSPEQCRNAQEVDIRSDIYAFGTVLFEMLTERRVFEATTFEAFKHCHLHKPPPSLASMVSGLPRNLETVVLRCLAKKPEERYPNFAVLREELAGIYHALTGEEISRPIKGEALEGWEWYNKGVSLATLDHPKEALACYERALAIDPINVSAWSNKGGLLADLGRYEEALACCNRALDIDPIYVYAWNNKGKCLVNLGYPEEALTCCNRALNINPRHTDALLNKGVSLFDLGHPEEALACYDRVLTINPRDARAWSNKGGTLADLGRYKEALVSCDHALDINPRLAQAWHNKGNAFFQSGCPDEALICYDRALAIDPRYVAAWSNKGASLAELARWKEAIACYDHALALDPKHATAWSNKGNALAALEHWEEALDCYDRALDINPEQANTWYNKGAALGNSERLQEALGCFIKALDIDSYYENAKQAIAICQQNLK